MRSCPLTARAVQFAAASLSDSEGQKAVGRKQKAVVTALFSAFCFLPTAFCFSKFSDNSENLDIALLQSSRLRPFENLVEGERRLNEGLCVEF